MTLKCLKGNCLFCFSALSDARNTQNVNHKGGSRINHYYPLKGTISMWGRGEVGIQNIC